MTEPTSAEELFKGRHFDREIIVLCVRWYLTFKLSSRDLVQMMAERGIVLAHTILRWVQSGRLPRRLRIRSCKYLNNVVEQDHRRIKQRVRPMLGFKRFETAAVTIRGIELAEKIKKQQFNLKPLIGKAITAPEMWAVVLAA
jgi:transposase-like protein